MFSGHFEHEWIHDSANTCPVLEMFSYRFDGLTKLWLMGFSVLAAQDEDSALYMVYRSVGEQEV